MGHRDSDSEHLISAKLADGPDGGHKLGSYLNGQIAKLISGKMPGGFPLSSVKGYLVSRYGLGEGRIEVHLNPYSHFLYKKAHVFLYVSL